MWLLTETEAPSSEEGEQGDWTQSHVKGQRAASPQGARSSHTQRAKEAMLGTKADSTDTSYPLRGWLSLPPWGTHSLICEELPVLHCWSPESSSCSDVAAEKVSTQSSKWTLAHISLTRGCFLSLISPRQLSIVYEAFNVDTITSWWRNRSKKNTWLFTLKAFKFQLYDKTVDEGW